ncbi:hypothetical protein OAY01_03615 [Luminiphilus sp.]|nr:hypothetical protein [Luminiphilus sp.]
MNIYKHLTLNAEHLQRFPFRRELVMQAYLIENQEILGLDDDLFSGDNVEIIEEELPVVGGRFSKNTDGRLDVLALYSNEYIAVVELKLGELKEEHLEQLEDYLKQRDKILEQGNLLDKLPESDGGSRRWVGVLVGESIDPGLGLKLKKGYAYGDDEIPIVALTINRFCSSNGSTYVTTDAFHDIKKNTKDYTKYKFNGAIYGKGKLVLAVIKQYVEENPDVTYAELEKKFPKKLQGSHGCFVKKELALKICAEKGKKRHFLKEDEEIKIKGCSIAVCTEWGRGNIDNFIKNNDLPLNWKIEPQS